MLEQIDQFIEDTTKIDIDSVLESFSIETDTEEIVNCTVDKIDSLGKCLQYTIESIKYSINENSLSALDFISLYYPLYKSLFEAYTSIAALIKICYCCLIKDGYDSIVSAYEKTEPYLEKFIDLQLKIKDIFGEETPLTDATSDPFIDMLKVAYAKRNEEVVPLDDYIKATKFYGLQLPICVQISIYVYQSYIDKYRKYRFERSDSDLEVIYNYWLGEYKKQKFPEIWESHKKRLISHNFKYKEITSSLLIKEREGFLQLFKNTPLGETWDQYECDGVEKLAYEISRLQVSRNELFTYFKNICILEKLDEWIEEIREVETQQDKIFKPWVDIQKLKDELVFWISANIKQRQDQWVIVFVAMRDLNIIKNETDPEEWSLRMNNLFGNVPVKCVYESFRKLLPKKVNPSKAHTQRIDTWPNNTLYYAQSKALYDKLENSRRKFTKEQFL